MSADAVPAQWTLTREGYLQFPSGEIIQTDTDEENVVIAPLSPLNSPFVCNQGETVDQTFGGGPGTVLECSAEDYYYDFYVCFSGVLKLKYQDCGDGYGIPRKITQLTIGGAEEG